MNTPSLTHSFSNTKVHRNIPDPDYRAIKALSKSSLTHFLKSPAHYLASTETPKETTDAMMFGTAYHAYVLTPDRFAENVVMKPEWDARTKEGKAIKAEFEASLGRKVYINDKQLDAIKAMKAALMEHKVASKLLAGLTDTEMAIESDYHPMHPKPGSVRIKGLLDGWDHNTATIIDLKTCKDASPEGFKWACKDFRYDMQEVQYRALINAAFKSDTHGGVDRFVFIAQEKEPPYAVACYTLSHRTLMTAYDEWRVAVHNFGECQTNAVWPGYAASLVELEIVR
jgi:hypothetical protein